MEDAIYALIPIIFILSVAGVIIFRPLSKRLGDLLEAYTQDRMAGEAEQRQLGGLREQLESLDRRMGLLEERMSFTEELVGRRPGRPLQGADRPSLDSGARAISEPAPATARPREASRE